MEKELFTQYTTIKGEDNAFWQSKRNHLLPWAAVSKADSKRKLCSQMENGLFPKTSSQNCPRIEPLLKGMILVTKIDTVPWVENVCAFIPMCCWELSF